MIAPIVLIAAGLITFFVFSQPQERDVPSFEPDLPPIPGSTRYKLVDAILPQLKQAADSSSIPLGVLVGWVATESGGKIGSAPKPLLGQTDSERGYFQLHPSESQSLGVDHARLSTDPAYSIQAGVQLVRKYMALADSFGVAPRGSTYYWMLVKLIHTMGSGAVKIIVDAAKKENQARTWEQLRNYAMDNEKKFLSATKHSPSKWFPHVDRMLAVGQPFGFGSTTIVGAVYKDIPDPLDCVRRG